MNRSLFHDTHYRLLFLNSLLVLIGYGIARIAGGTPVVAFQVVKYAVLGFSLFLLRLNRPLLLNRAYTVCQGCFFFIILVLITALLSAHPIETFSRALTLVVPLLYLMLLIVYFWGKYPASTIFTAMLHLVLIVYSLPVLTYFMIGGTLYQTNIYRIASENPRSYFVSNHYAWSATLVLASALDLLWSKGVSPLKRNLFWTLIAASVYIVLIAGNRASWICLFTIVIMLLSRHTSDYFFRLIVVSGILVVTIHFLRDPGSALNTRLIRTSIQLERGEPRKEIATRMFEHFNQHPACYLKGIGSFNQQVIHSVTGNHSIHNSYLDVFFGTGVPVFIVFLFIFCLRPLRLYLTRFSQNFVCLPPLLIIPFFESNLTAGQFLYFPWMLFTLTFSYCHSLPRLLS